MPHSTPRRHCGAVAMGVALAFIMAWSIPPAAQQGLPPAPKRAAIRAITSIAGKDLYNAYCAQCHGAKGKGDGPAAAGLKTPPADLTQIAAKNGGKFNRTAVEAFIKGDRPGGRPDEMPVWGIVFRYVWPDEPIVIRCGNLARYIEKLQVK